MVHCAIRDCDSAQMRRENQDLKIKSYRIPKDKAVADQWLRYCKPNTSLKTGRVCSLHFTPDDNLLTMRQRLMNETSKTLKKDAVPSLLLPADKFEVKLEDPLSLDHNYLNDHNYADVTPRSSPNRVCPVNASEKGSPKMRKAAKNYTARPFSRKLNQFNKNVEIPLAIYNLLKKKVSTYEMLIKNLKQIFTPGQIHSLSQPGIPRVHWSTEDIESAVSLRNISPEAYDHLKDTGVPLPCAKTLKTWSAKCGVFLKELDDTESSKDSSAMITDGPN